MPRKPSKEMPRLMKVKGRKKIQDPNRRKWETVAKGFSPLDKMPSVMGPIKFLSEFKTMTATKKRVKLSAQKVNEVSTAIRKAAEDVKSKNQEKNLKTPKEIEEFTRALMKEWVKPEKLTYIDVLKLKVKRIMKVRENSELNFLTDGTNYFIEVSWKAKDKKKYSKYFLVNNKELIGSLDYMAK